MKAFSLFRFLWLAAALAVLPIGAAQAEPSSVAAPAPVKVSVDHGTAVALNSAASSVFIANPEVADVQVLSPTSLMVFGKRTGNTTLVASDVGGKTILHRVISVSQNLDDLRMAMNAVIPNNRIKVEAIPSGIVMTGEVKDAAAAEDARRLAARYVPKEGGEVINRLQVRGNNQIQIRVRFAEVSRDVDKRFGINWESIGNIGGFAFGLATGTTVLASGTNLLDRARPTSGSDVNGVVSVTHTGQRHNINGLIDALAKDGLITVLAEPNLTAMSGETASFLAGGEFPIPVPQSQTTVTIEWKQYGVSLAFTPTITNDDRINLHVRPEVSQLTDAGSVTLNNIVVPALVTRRAETTIELQSGQSFAIAGLLNNSQNQSVDKYPFLGDVPILGPLFRSTRFQNNESELVIIITPYVVRPAASEENLALPTDGLSLPSDTDRLVRMRTTNSSTDARALSGNKRARNLEPPEVVRQTEDSMSAPSAAPASAVVTAPVEPSPPPPPAMPKQSLPSAPATVRPESGTALSGPGGFILE